MVEVLTKYLKDIFDHDPRKPPRIRAYRGGYLPTERREVEKAMRAGQIDGIVSTSALELGVDIGALDVVVLNGYPGSVAATWQRFGRAGRRQQPALGVLVASSQPLDQYVVRHPDFFADASPEHARIAPDQTLILFDHIRCAAFELPFNAGEPFGQVDPLVFLEALAESGVIHQEGERWEWIADSYPANAVSLRSVADGNFVVVDRRRRCKQQIIAEVDYLAAALTLYEGAIHMVQSTPYQVERLDSGRPQGLRHPHPCRLLHRQHRLHQAQGAGPLRRGLAGRGDCHHGEVHVVRRVAGYKKIRYYTHENIGYGPVNLPDQELHTTSVWWQLPQATLGKAFSSRQDALDGFLGAAYALHVVATVAVMADARDLQKAVAMATAQWFAVADQSGRGQLRGADGAEGHVELQQQFVPTVYLYDNFPGGVGLSEPLLWQRQAELVARAGELVHRCDCRAGCPACVGLVLAARGARRGRDAEDAGAARAGAAGLNWIAVTALTAANLRRLGMWWHGRKRRASCACCDSRRGKRCRPRPSQRRRRPLSRCSRGSSARSGTTKQYRKSQRPCPRCHHRSHASAAPISMPCGA